MSGVGYSRRYRVRKESKGKGQLFTILYWLLARYGLAGIEKGRLMLWAERGDKQTRPSVQVGAFGGLSGTEYR